MTYHESPWTAVVIILFLFSVVLIAALKEEKANRLRKEEEERLRQAALQAQAERDNYARLYHMNMYLSRHL